MGIWTKRRSCDYRKKGKCETEFHTVVRNVVKKGRFCDTFEKQKRWNLYYVHWQLPGTLFITGVKWEEHTCTHTHTCILATHVHTHTHKHVRMHAHSPTCMHALCMYTHMNMHTHTHTHTHTQNVNLESAQLFLFTSWDCREKGLTHSQLWSCKLEISSQKTGASSMGIACWCSLPSQTVHFIAVK